MSSVPSKEKDTLKMVQVIFRHGLRTPYGGNVYPDDPNQDFWNLGISQLTKEGRQQMFKVGEYLHTRYQKLINYNPRSIYARSSGLERCFESCACFLASFCPPKGYYDWNPALNWQPIPINYVPAAQDTVLYPKDAKATLARIFNPEVKKGSRIEQTINRIESSIGISFDDKVPFVNLCDGIICQALHNLTLEPKVQERLPDINEVSDLYYQAFASSPTDVINCGSGLFAETVENIHNYLSSTGKIMDLPTKCYVYSTSDFMIFALMKILGVCIEKFIGFGSTFVIELHEIDQKPLIKLLYNGNTTQDASDFEELHIKGFGSYYTVEDFKDAERRFLEENKSL